jgi:4'-phosphopantetheinyl transferase
LLVAAQPGLSFQFHECAGAADYPAALSLGEHEVHVWQAALDRLSPCVTDLSQTLSSDEKERAVRLRDEKHRNEFIISRGMLRTLLGSYLGIPAPGLSFVYSSHGKPGLDTLPLARGLAFNVSHTEGIALFAFTLNRKIGVDVEKVRRNFEVEKIAERFFSVAERLALRNLPAEQRYEAFFRCWTRKEAYIKARGEGLSHPLHQFDVSLAPEEPAALLTTHPNPGEASRWLLRPLPVTPGYMAALAVEVESIVLVPS